MGKFEEEYGTNGFFIGVVLAIILTPGAFLFGTWLMILGSFGGVSFLIPLLIFAIIFLIAIIYWSVRIGKLIGRKKDENDQ